MPKGEIRVGDLGVMVFYDASVPPGHVRLAGRDYPLGEARPPQPTNSELRRWAGETADDRIKEMQDILRPLLDSPMRPEDSHDAMYDECVFCGASHPTCGPGCFDHPTHKLDCPVLRKDEILSP